MSPPDDGRMATDRNAPAMGHRGKPHKYSLEVKHLKVLVVEPEKRPHVKDIDGGLKSLQAEVGGLIQAVYPFDDPIAIICNDEGKLNGFPYNRALYSDDGTLYDVVAGTFLVVGLVDDDFGSLSDELVEKYRKHFFSPEFFLNIGGRLVVVK